MLKGIIKFTQAQYEEFMKNKTITVNGITYNYDPDVLYTVEKVNVTTDTKQTISGDKDFTGKLTLNSKDVAIKEEVVTLIGSQTISGEKKFTGGIFKNDYEVASLNDIPPVVDALNSESSTSSLSARQGKVLDEKISNAIATLNGKNNSFTFYDLETLLSNFGLEKGSEAADSYLIDTDKISYNGQEYTLKNGDVFFIVDTSVPDYWYSLDDKTLYKLETTRVDLAEYAKTSDLTDYAKTSDLSDYAKTSALSDYAKISALSDYAKLSDISTTYLKQNDIADWAKSANPPSNVVFIDDVDQNVDGLKIFLKGIETGGSNISTESGLKDARRCADDSNNTHQISLFVDSKGVANLTHKNRTVNASSPDSYISFDATKLKYGTGWSNGTAASDEYDIITSNYDAYKFALQEFNRIEEFGKVLHEKDIDYVSYNQQSLTDAQKLQARTNIGAGTSNFSGNYRDLVGTPSIPTDYISYSASQNLTSTQKNMVAQNIGIDKPWNLWWTNSNSNSLSGNSAFTAQDITLFFNMTSGQAYEIKVVYLVEPAGDDSGYASYQEQTFVFWGGSAKGRGRFSGVPQDDFGESTPGFRFYQRELKKGTAANVLSFTSCKRYGYAASAAIGESNWNCVPAYIYGREIDMIFAS